MGRRARNLLAALAAIGALIGPACASASAARGLTLGFSNDAYLASGSDAQRAPWIARALHEGASIVRVDLAWSTVAPERRPAGFDPANPASPGYDWTSYDGVIRDLAGHGLEVLITISSAPRWAEGPRRPRSAPFGSWRPDAAQFGQFAAAAARRYDGHFADPADPGQTLPRVRLWEAWNEPNLDTYLSPQWVRIRGGWAPVAPVIYRRMANAFYSSVKAASASNLVVIGATAPYGDPPGSDPLGQERTPPVAFYRELFCLRGAVSLTPTRCPDPPHFDAIDHHPYGIGGPTWHAINPDDAAVPDIYKIARVVRAAVRAGHALPRGRKGLWVAEFGWSSRPPNPRGVPVAQDARWYEQALYVLWRQGVETILPLELGDPAHVTNYSAVFESGLYYSDGRPKPIATAFRFPFIAQSAGRGRVSVWGRAPRSGTLEVQVLEGRRWRALASFPVSRHGVFLREIALHGSPLLRAALRGELSLPWRA